MLSFPEIILAIFIAVSTVSLLPLTSSSSSALLDTIASPTAAPPSGPKPFQLMLHNFNRTFSWKRNTCYVYTF